RDQLRVLPAVVEDDDLVDLARSVDIQRRLRDQLGRGRRRCDDVIVHASAGALSLACSLEPAAVWAAAAAPREPMPTPWEACSSLPSVISAGAIISSARLNSAMSL